jgi:hypothetical protein
VRSAKSALSLCLFQSTRPWNAKLAPSSAFVSTHAPVKWARICRAGYRVHAEKGGF